VEQQELKDLKVELAQQDLEDHKELKDLKVELGQQDFKELRDH
jgi:hypothetical protein